MSLNENQQTFKHHTTKMTLQFIKDWLCCCCQDTQEKYNIYDENDETTRLIPDNLEPIHYANSTLVDQQQKLQERLGTIVRAKEGQMVNVTSRIPFNLHNQILPPETWLNANPNLSINTSLSRSTSRSDLVQTLTHSHPYDFSRNAVTYRHPLHPGNPYPRVFSSSESPESSRSDSPERETVTAATITTTMTRPNPILNVRLVGFVEQRGRSREREHQRDRDLDADSNLVGSDTTVTQSHIPNISPNSIHDHDIPPLGNLNLQESGAISLSWGD